MKDRFSIVHPTFFFFATLLMIGTGCSLFLGNIKPVEEKSQDYSILNLSSHNPDWTVIEAKADQTYQSKETGATISINSSCKNFDSHLKPDLKSLTRELLLGIPKISSHKQESITLNKLPALRTTIQGQIDSEPLMMRTVVVEKGRCVFDFIYIALADRFKTKESDFTDFVNSWKVN